jgi:formiminoglutamase
MTSDWLRVTRADTPLIIALPHGGTELPAGAFRSSWHARRDADWHIAALYEGLAEATTVATAVSRSVIDVNRDPSGASLYPGQATTELCPTTTFDGDSLYPGEGPDEAEIARRTAGWFEPYHAALGAEVERLRKRHRKVVVFDAHSIRSRVPRLFEGELPELNIGTNGGTTCAPALLTAIERVAAGSGRSRVVDGRFRGGWTTRHYGRPYEGVHAIQLELAMRAYVDEPAAPHSPASWPPPFDPAVAAPLRDTLRLMLAACLDFTQ